MNDRYDPKIHHRRSIRLKGYDYSLGGAYFVTITARGRACLFGEVAGEQMRLNEARGHGAGGVLGVVPTVSGC